MVAINNIKMTLVILGVLLVLVLGFQNCAVEISDETVGAASGCEPNAQELTDFQAALTGFLQKTGQFPGGADYCGACHLTNSGNPARSKFGILPGTTTADQSTNWCTAKESADLFSAGFLQTTHQGGTYPEADIQALMDWADTIK